jgi:hypothetical protein
MLPLRELQLRFAAALTPGAAPDSSLLAVVAPGGPLAPAERVVIYADMYQARLVDVLREDFPRTLALLGDDAFLGLAERYLVQHPSTHPSVRDVGGRFAEFVAGEVGMPPWLTDLARLEWARVEVFDAADADPLRLADLKSIAPENWPALRLRPIPSCRVVESAWPVHEIWAARDLDAGQRLPAEPRSCAVRVWREGFSVCQAAMGEEERRVFALVQRGEPFARLCAILEGDREPEAAAREIGALLMRWLEDEVLTRQRSSCESF